MPNMKLFQLFINECELRKSISDDKRLLSEKIDFFVLHCNIIHNN